MGVGFDPFTIRPQELRPGFDVTIIDQDTAAGIGSRILERDLNRVALVLQQTGTGECRLLTSEGLDASSGFLLTSDMQPIKLLYTEIGPAVGAEWRVRGLVDTGHIYGFALSWRGVDRR